MKINGDFSRHEDATETSVTRCSDTSAAMLVRCVSFFNPCRGSLATFFFELSSSLS